MSLRTRFTDVYVCLECSLKLRGRLFSSTATSSSSVPTALQSLDSSAFVDRYFEKFPPPAPASRRAHVRDDDEDRRDKNNGEPSPSGSISKGKIRSSPRLHNSQVESIAVLGKIAKELPLASSPNASVKKAVKRLRPKKRGVQRHCIDTLSQAYSEQSLEDISRDLEILQRLDKKQPVQGPAENLVFRLTKNGVLKAPPQSPWQDGSPPKSPESDARRSDHALDSFTANNSSDVQVATASVPKGRRIHRTIKAGGKGSKAAPRKRKGPEDKSEQRIALESSVTQGGTAQGDVVRSKAAQSNTVQSKPARSKTARSKPAQSKAAASETAQARTAQNDTVENNAVQNRTGESDAGQSRTAKRETVKRKKAKPKPTKTREAKTRAVKPRMVSGALTPRRVIGAIKPRRVSGAIKPRRVSGAIKPRRVSGTIKPRLVENKAAKSRAVKPLMVKTKAAKSGAISRKAIKGNMMAEKTTGRLRRWIRGTGDVSSRSKAQETFTSTIQVQNLSVSHLTTTGPPVPHLCHDLSRVLFNPGIYQLQDLRSRVYNFDPYLEKIMPISEFDFRILKDYITSSRDETLHSLALQHGKKYVGSSSSMTSTLAQFHFLLSQWRVINTSALSRGFSETLDSFTVIQRSPSAVFLRYQDGVYALDADKEFDSANILMSLGKSMEKLLTQRPRDFERYRKTSLVKVPEEEKSLPDAYQYTHAGDFLMRAQLDAHDPRLPGTGTFDLKTRAVVSIRHNIQQHEEVTGYQIKKRFGTWESYEREYYDMMRSAFLKYSLQVRMGEMDGIFVAFHNIDRIFGFQYISLPEMDMAIHGQEDTTLGDQEFRLSVQLLNEVLNRVTARFPKRSMRLLFETRKLPSRGTYMSIFAEPMDEARIDAIQNSKKEAIDAFERGLKNPGNNAGATDTVSTEQSYSAGEATQTVADGEDVLRTTKNHQEVKDTASTERAQDADQAKLTTTAGETRSQEASMHSINSEAGEASVEAAAASTAEEVGSEMEILALTLRIQNKVDGKIVERPTTLTGSKAWTLDYSLEEVTSHSSSRNLYQASKGRRRAALEAREDGVKYDYYLRRVREMAASGAEWRKSLDELDANRPRVVLYGL